MDNQSCPTIFKDTNYHKPNRLLRFFQKYKLLQIEEGQDFKERNNKKYCQLFTGSK